MALEDVTSTSSSGSEADSGLPSDADIVSALKRGDEDGLRALLSKHGGRVRRGLSTLLPGRPDLVEDAMSRATQQIWQKPSGLDEEKDLAGYLFVIAKNVARKSLRSEAMEREVLLDYVKTPGASSPSEAQQKLLVDLRACIERLGPLQQHIVREDLSEGKSSPAGPIAALFGTSKNTVYVSRRRAYDRLRELLGECGHFIEDETKT